jgi:RsbT co-antagonist protein rsbRD N-terminal domain
MVQIRTSDFIRGQRERLLAEWEAAVRALPAAQALDQASLLCDMPQIVSRTIDWVDRGDVDDLAEIERLARLHADQRLRNGFDLRQVVAEYRTLRACILRLSVKQWRERQSVDALNRIAKLDGV